MATTVLLDADARKELDDLPIPIHGRVIRIIERLHAWPDVSGAKPLRHGMAGQFRIRTGNYRVQFKVRGSTLTIVKIGHRDGFYEE